MTQQMIIEEGAFASTPRTQINDNFTEVYNDITSINTSITSINSSISTLNSEVAGLQNIVVFIPYVIAQFSDVTKTSDTTLEDLGTLSLNVNSPQRYQFILNIQCSSTTNGGINVAMNFGATLSAFSASVITDSGFSLVPISTTPGVITLRSEKTADTTLLVMGTFTVSSSGTLTIQGAQNTSSSDTTTFYAGSSMQITIF